MKTMKKTTLILLLTILIGVSGTAQAQEKRFSDRLLIDLTGIVSTPMTLPLGVGAGAGVGLSFRDFNLLLKPQVLFDDPTGNSKTVINPVLQVEAKIPIIRNLITLIPYANTGVLMTKFIRADGTQGPYASGFYLETGAGVDIPITHEISFLPRVGFAYATVVESQEKINHSGFIASASLRYAFGNTKGLDY